jgi:NADH-quinone oxidoreductase subunit J
MFEISLKIILIFLGLSVINAKNPVYSVLSLIMLFFFSAVLLIYMGVNFLGMVFLVVYIGAVAVLFLFVVMMINIRYVELTSNELYYLSLNGLLLLIPFSFQLIFYKYNLNAEEIAEIDYLKLYVSLTDVEVLGMLLYGFEFGPIIVLAALILFVAMVGSIALTFSNRCDIKKQDLYDQLYTDFTSSVKVYEIKPKN